MVARVKYTIRNKNSGILDLKGTDVTISGRSSGEAYLTPGLKAELENSARVTVTAIPELKPVVEKSPGVSVSAMSANQEPRKDTARTRPGGRSGEK